MKNKLLSFWNNLSGNQRRNVVWSGAVCAFLTVYFLGSMAMNRGKSALPVKSAKQTTLDIEPKLLEKSQFLESQKEIAKRDDKLAALQQKLDEITREKKGEVVVPPQMQPGVSPSVPGDTRIAATGQQQGQPQKAGSGRTVISKQPLPPPPPIPQSNISLPPLPATAQGMAAGQLPSHPKPRSATSLSCPIPGQVNQARLKLMIKKKTQPPVPSICLLPLWRRPC